MRDTGGDVLAFAAAYAGGFLAHSKTFPVISNAAVMPAATPKQRAAIRSPLPACKSKITSSCRRLTWPGPCACAHWCEYADRAPADRGDDAGRDSSRGPSDA